MKMTKIAVILAGHNGNSGMYSVDLAAARFFAAHHCDFTLFTAQEVFDRSFTIEGIPVLSIDEQTSLREYTHLVYWGDFINNPAYGIRDFASRDVKLGISPDIDSAYLRWKKIFNLHETQFEGTVISVGNNFQNDLSGFTESDPDVLSRLAERFDAILPRDPFSLQNLANVLPRGSWTKIRQGMDCAFLLMADEPRSPERYFCYFFGRSKIEDMEQLVKEIEEVTGARGVPIDRWLKLRPRNAHTNFLKSRDMMRNAAFVVSDTYHFLINSITMGVPVIALGRSVDKQRGTLGDFKKYTLFSMLGIENYYIPKTKKMSSEDYFGLVKIRAVQLSESSQSTFSRYDTARTLSRKFRSDLDYAIFGKR